MKKKVFSTLIILLILVIALIFDYKFFAIAMGICASLSFLEFFKYKFKNTNLDFIKLISILSLLFILFNNVFYTLPNIIPFIISLLLIIIPIVVYDDNKRYNITDAIYILGVVIFLAIPYCILIQLCKIDVVRCIYIFLIAFMCDIYSYIGTRLIGKNKINNTNRTIEGSLIGIVMSSFITSVYHYNLVGGNIAITIIISFVLSIASIVGDILFYNVKRKLNQDDLKVKVIDQFDSVILTALLYMIIINII